VALDLVRNKNSMHTFFFFCYSLLISPSLQCVLNILFIALLILDYHFVCVFVVYGCNVFYLAIRMGGKARSGQKVHGQHYFLPGLSFESAIGAKPKTHFCVFICG